VGERTREGNDLLIEMTESEVIDKVALCYGQMNEPPERACALGLSGLTMAEYFRDQGQDVLLFIDNIFRFVRPAPRSRRLLGRMPSAVRLPADARHRDGPAAGAHHVDDQGRRHERAGDLRAADDLTDPAPAQTFAHLDATTTLSRAIVEQGIYPAVDPLDSTSRALQPGIVSDEHYRTATTGPGGLAALQGPAGHHRHPRIEELSDEDRLTVSRARKIQRCSLAGDFVARAGDPRLTAPRCRGWR